MQQTFSEIRQAIATYLAAQLPDLTGAVATRLGEITPPCAVVVPVAGGTVATYSQTFDGQVDYHLRVIIMVPMSSSEFGQDALDPYLDTTSPDSVWAAFKRDPTCGGGVIGYAVCIEATGYGEMNQGSVDYLACSFIIEIGD